MSVSKFAKPDQAYQTRNLDLLKQLGAVNDKEAELMGRAAEFAGPGNQISPAALQALETPERESALFPLEKKLRGDLWAHLEWQEVAEAPAAVTLPAFTVQDGSKIGAELDLTASFPISDLKADLHQVAKRVQLVASSDADKKTISVADVDKALEHDGFNDSEKSSLGSIRTVLLAMVQAQPPNMKAIVEVPTPGDERLPMEHTGKTKFFLVSTVNIAAQATLTTPVWTARNLTITRSLAVEVEVPKGEKLMIMPHDRTSVAGDILLEEGTHRPALVQGQYRVERWKGGKRIESSDLNVPALNPSNQNISQFVDYELRSNGDPIPRVLKNIVAAVARHGRGRQNETANFEYSFDAKSVDGDTAPFDSKSPQMPPGRYQVFPSLILDVFEGGAVRAEVSGQQAPITWQNQQTGSVQLAGNSININAANNSVTMTRRGLPQQAPLRPHMRLT